MHAYMLILPVLQIMEACGNDLIYRSGQQLYALDTQLQHLQCAVQKLLPRLAICSRLVILAGPGDLSLDKHS